MKSTGAGQYESLNPDVIRRAGRATGCFSMSQAHLKPAKTSLQRSHQPVPTLASTPFDYLTCGRVAPMPEPNDKRTIISMAVVASAAATLLHEGVGHGVVA